MKDLNYYFQNNGREYYFCCGRLDKKDYYFIWFSDEEDGVYLNSKGEFMVSYDFESLEKYAEKQKLLIKSKEADFYNFEKLEEVLNHTEFKVDCCEFLNAWNLFSDISCSTKEDFDSDRKVTNQIYEKLFWGDNLPAVTPEGKSFEPIWSNNELEIIRDVLLNGIAIFRDKVKYIDE